MVTDNWKTSATTTVHLVFVIVVKRLRKVGVFRFLQFEERFLEALLSCGFAWTEGIAVFYNSSGVV